MTGTRENVLDHVYKLFYGDLGLCACGNPESAYSLVRDLLALAPFHKRTHAEIANLIGTEGAYHLVLGQLDGAGLIEHGSSIGGSWLTPKGEWCLAALRTIPDWSEIENSEGAGIGFPHSGDDCADACWTLAIEVERRDA
jgi:hypothetical protein